MVTRRADRPRLFIEDPAGLAAVSLRLHGGPNCRPPISRMGSKTGYAQTILAALGLQSGQGAGAYLWVEADRDVAALLRCYPDADMLRRIAEIKRTAERFEGMAREVAGDLTVRRLTIPQAQARGAGPSDFNGGKAQSAEGCAADVGRIASGWPPVVVTRRIPEPAEVAEWLGTPGDLSGVVRYADPPYENTTRYAYDYPRAEVVRLALAYAAMGATVCVSEATPIPELVEAGWEVCEITGGRVGQKRTFSAQKREFLTMNRAPAHRVAEQVGMFGGAA